jgi:hypothetical protein
LQRRKPPESEWWRLEFLESGRFTPAVGFDESEKKVRF